MLSLEANGKLPHILGIHFHHLVRLLGIDFPITVAIGNSETMQQEGNCMLTASAAILIHGELTIH